MNGYSVEGICMGGNSWCIWGRNDASGWYYQDPYSKPSHSHWLPGNTIIIEFKAIFYGVFFFFFFAERMIFLHNFGGFCFYELFMWKYYFQNQKNILQMVRAVWATDGLTGNWFCFWITFRLLIIAWVLEWCFWYMEMKFDYFVASLNQFGWQGFTEELHQGSLDHLLLELHILES